MNALNKLPFAYELALAGLLGFLVLWAVLEVIDRIRRRRLRLSELDRRIEAGWAAMRRSDEARAKGRADIDRLLQRIPRPAFPKPELKPDERAMRGAIGRTERRRM
jgi:hypothetical protein